MEASLNPISTPASWASTLQEAVASRRGVQAHKYIVRDNNTRELSVTAIQDLIRPN